MNGLCQLIIDAVSAVFDRNGAGSSAAGNDCDGLAAVTAQGKQKGDQFAVIGGDAMDGQFFSFRSFS